MQNTITKSNIEKLHISKKVHPHSGILAALWIPFGENGQVDRTSLEKHLDWLKAQGVHGILALGSTGEFIRMELAQKIRVLNTVMELATPLPVLANLSSIRLDEVIALGKEAQRLGVAGVALMPPYFYQVSQADMLEFFLRAAESVSLPFYLYNFPELTGNRIGLETVAAFADRASMAGIKQSGGEFSYHQSLIQLGKEKKFSVFSGADTRLAEVLKLGAAGCIGGLVNIVPDVMVRIFQSCGQKQNTGEDVAELSSYLVDVGRVIDQLTFPLNVACGLEARGFNPGVPKTVVSSESKQLYRKTMEDLRVLFAKWDRMACIRKVRA